MNPAQVAGVGEVAVHRPRGACRPWRDRLVVGTPLVTTDIQSPRVRIGDRLTSMMPRSTRCDDSRICRHLSPVGTELAHDDARAGSTSVVHGDLPHCVTWARRASRCTPGRPLHRDLSDRQPPPPRPAPPRVDGAPRARRLPRSRTTSPRERHLHPQRCLSVLARGRLARPTRPTANDVANRQAMQEAKSNYDAAAAAFSSRNDTFNTARSTLRSCLNPVGLRFTDRLYYPDSVAGATIQDHRPPARSGCAYQCAGLVR